MQKALEEFAVLVEVFDGVGVVGARALHELIEVARKVLPGLLARVISRGDQREVGRSAAIFSILFPLLCGGALVLILVLGLAFASAFVGARRSGARWKRWTKFCGPGPSGLRLRSLLHASWFSPSRVYAGGRCGAFVKSR